MSIKNNQSHMKLAFTALFLTAAVVSGERGNLASKISVVAIPTIWGLKGSFSKGTNGHRREFGTQYNDTDRLLANDGVERA